jgi:Fe-S oxidoreductase
LIDTKKNVYLTIFVDFWIIKVIIKMYLLDNKKVRYIKDTSSIFYHKNCHTTKKIKI